MRSWLFPKVGFQIGAEFVERWPIRIRSQNINLKVCQRKRVHSSTLFTIHLAFVDLTLLALLPFHMDESYGVSNKSFGRQSQDYRRIIL